MKTFGSVDGTGSLPDRIPQIRRAPTAHFRFSFGQTVSKLYQNPFSLACLYQNSRPARWRLPVGLQQCLSLHLQFHLRVLLEDVGVTLAQQLGDPFSSATPPAESLVA